MKVCNDSRALIGSAALVFGIFLIPASSGPHTIRKQRETTREQQRHDDRDFAQEPNTRARRGLRQIGWVGGEETCQLPGLSEADS